MCDCFYLGTSNEIKEKTDKRLVYDSPTKYPQLKSVPSLHDMGVAENSEYGLKCNLWDVQQCDTQSCNRNSS